MDGAVAPETAMVLLAGGEFRMGSGSFYPDEAPVHQRTVAPFEIDLHPVTNRQFAAFVEATGYVTVAERPLDPADFPAADPADLVPGGLVFTSAPGPVDLSDWRQWWRWGAGANWRQPFGPGSDAEGKEDHPVVQVSFEDAWAYADWVGKRLPTEAEWEFAARGGLDGAVFAWGDEARPDDRLMANTWQGRFPYLNTGANGWVGTSPVMSFPPNGYGLYDCIGNVWEWTSSYYSSRHEPPESNPDEGVPAPGAAEYGPVCTCSPQPAGNSREAAQAAASTEPGSAIPRRVLKGGSHLCAPEYCLRYRPAARSPQADDTATTHIGFRCVRS
jgi:formylglycine-generating enzyme required for sulfatase activity